MVIHPSVLQHASNFIFAGDAAPAGLPQRVLLLDQLRDLYQRARSGGEGGIHDRLLAELGVQYRVEPQDRERIPATGPAVIVANHPFGILEGPILGSLLPSIRPDVKVMTNYLLSGMKELHPFCIFVDPFNGPGSRRANLAAMREAVNWLREGHALVVFPSGEVSHWSMAKGAVADPEWNQGIGRLIRITNATVVPMFFAGVNSLPFHLLGMIHPRLRTAALAGELLNKRGRSVDVRVGRPISSKTVAEQGDDRELMQYLRFRTYLLQKRSDTAIAVSTKPSEPLAAPANSQAMAAEVEALPKLEETREFQVCLASASQIPNCLHEIGRLREITFRAAGEGTGNRLDLDHYDRHYQHLFLWNKSSQEIAGAYRLCRTDRVLREHGIHGLYSRSLFAYDHRLLNAVGPAIELGRSFVRPEYQKQFASLLLLWKGIGRYVVDNADAPVLFGAVSISNDYSDAARQLMVQYLSGRSASDPLTRLVKPRRPFRARGISEWDTRAFTRMFRDLDDLSAPISDLERDGKGVPVLLRQYTRLGGRVLAFSVDPDFGNALDGLILVDLRQTNPSALERYLGKEGTAAFFSRQAAARAA